MAEEVTEERDNTFQGDNLHDIQASNARYLYGHLRINEILTRLDRLEEKNGLTEPVEVEPVIEGQPAWAREVYLKENEVLPIFPGPDNSTPVYVEDEAAFRDRIAGLENKPVGLKPEDREEEEEPKANEEGEQLSLFDEQGNLRDDEDRV